MAKVVLQFTVYTWWWRGCLNQNVEFENRCDSAETSYETLNSGVHHICLELCGKTLSKYDHTAASEQNSFSWKCDFSDILTLSPRFRSIFDDPSRDIWDAAYKQRGRLWTSMLQRERSDDDMIAKVWSMVSDVGVWGWWDKGDLPFSSDYQKC